jgi:hypothetical protein
MRVFLAASAAFALLAGSLLALGADRTDERFAWTISSDLTVGYLNGMYWASTILLVLAARTSTWAAARYGAYGAVLFMSLLFLVMLIHFDVLHTDDPKFLGSAGAWSFLAAYSVLPLLGVVAIAGQVRHGGAVPPGTDPIAAWLQVVFAAQAVVLAGAGLALLVGGADADGIWPWPLTPIASRAIGAWLISLAAISGLAARDADWRRIEIVPPCYSVIAVLQAIVLVRFSDQVDWGLSAWAYLAMLATFFAVAVVAIRHWLARAAAPA